MLAGGLRSQCWGLGVPGVPIWGSWGLYVKDPPIDWGAGVPMLRIPPLFGGLGSPCWGPWGLHVKDLLLVWGSGVPIGGLEGAGVPMLKIPPLIGGLGSPFGGPGGAGVPIWGAWGLHVKNPIDLEGLGSPFRVWGPHVGGFRVPMLRVPLNWGSGVPMLRIPPLIGGLGSRHGGPGGSGVSMLKGPIDLGGWGSWGPHDGVGVLSVGSGSQ